MFSVFRGGGSLFVCCLSVCEPKRIQELRPFYDFFLCAWSLISLFYFSLEDLRG